uniref:EF-hand domain-containing protein n=1 Tax=Aquila chrysaetos chrysaetos TaxID=223781 RepID=A0A663DZG7_AQUCH
MFCCLSLPSKMKTDLELALECAINIYHQYAMKCPIDDYLSKTEFLKLLKETPNTSIDDYISKLFARADHNHDGRLKFTEFLTTLNLVVIDAHNRSHQCHSTGSQDNRATGSQLSSTGCAGSPF